MVGLKNYSTIFGVLSLFYGIGVAIGPVVAAKVYDSTGSFNHVWVTFAVLAIILVFTTTFAVKKAQGFSQISEE
jgi:cyanate permease